jgi:hypothetical protein
MHKELLHDLVEGVQTLAECHDSLLEQFHGLSGMPPTTVVAPQLLNNSAANSASSSVTPPSLEPRLPPPECFNGEQSTWWAFLAQCALVFKLQPTYFPSDRSKIAYLITLMSGGLSPGLLPCGNNSRPYALVWRGSWEK